jgi:hypothetical protein
MHALVLLAFLLLPLLAWAGSDGDTLVCDTRAGAVAAVQAAWVLDAGSRFIQDPAPDAALLDTETALVQAAAGPVRPDARTYFYTTPAFLTPVLVTYTLGAGATSGQVAADPCTALAAAIDAGPLPWALVMLLKTLDAYTTLVSQKRRCDEDANMVPLVDAATGEFACGCVPGTICTPAADPDRVLVWFIGILLAVMAGGYVLYSVVTGAAILRAAKRLRKVLKPDKQQQLQTLVAQ